MCASRGVCVSSFGVGLRSCGCCCRVLTATAVPTGVVRVIGHLWICQRGATSGCSLTPPVAVPRCRPPAPGPTKIDREAFGKFFDGTPGKSWDDYASRLKNAAAGEVDDRVEALTSSTAAAPARPSSTPSPGEWNFK